MKYHIAPSVLSFPHGELAGVVKAMEPGGPSWIHLDVMDGQFVPPITFGAQMAENLHNSTTVPMEAHLMTLTPEAHFDAFIAAGCTRITFHAEVTNHAHRLVQSLRSKGIQAGLAINPATPVEAVYPILKDLDLVLVMTVNPGWGGQPFIYEALEKVKAIRERAPEVDIQVDGGIDPTTLPKAIEAGANVFVVGSYLSKQANIAEGIRALKKLCD